MQMIISFIIIILLYTQLLKKMLHSCNESRSRNLIQNVMKTHNNIIMLAGI